jgi:Fe(3+) dicitrate transport protein
MDSDVSYQGQDDKAAYAANPYLVPFTANWDNMDSHQHRYYLRHIAELSDSMSLTSTLFHNEFNRNWYKMNKVSSVIGTLNTPTGNVKWDNKNNNRNYKTTGFQTNLDFEVGSNDFDFGFRVMSEDYTQNPYTQDTYEYTFSDQTVKQSVNAGKSKLAGQDPYKHSDSTEIYLIDTVSLGALTVTPGVRYTDVDYQNASTKGSVDDVLIGIGSNYELSDTLSVFAGIHEGHAMPGAGAVNKGSGHIDKEIEESLAFELGARGMFGKIGYEVTYFNTSFENLIAAESIALATLETYNVGDASIQGLEVSLATDFGSDQGFGIPVSLSATFSDSEFDSLKSDTAGGGFTGDGIYEGAVVGNSFAYVPDMQLNLRGGLVFDKASTYLNFRYQDEVYTTGANTDKIGAQGLLDWSGFYDIKEGVNVFAKVSNLTDEQYTHSTLPRGHRPGAPRLWSLGMEFDF